MDHPEAVYGVAEDRVARPPSRRRILLIGPLPPPAHGVAVMTKNLLDSSVADRFEIVHLDTADRRGVDNIGRLDAGNVWLAAVHGTRFVRLLVRHSFDIVYLPVSKNPLGFLRDSLFIGPAAMRGTPVILHFHGAEFDRFVRTAPAPLRILVRALVRRASRAIVPGDGLKPMLRNLIAGERIVTVPNGVADLPAGREPSGPRHGRVHILFLGNLLPGKGYVALLVAVQLLLDEGLDIEATFAGAVVDADAHGRALSTVRYGVDRIRFSGEVDSAVKVTLLRSVNVLALPSEDEAQPLVILEAMAAGLPVVSTRRGAIPETVVDGQTGLLVEARDTPALTAALRRLIVDPALRERIGRAARARYVACYTVERWAERMATVFADVTAGRAP